MYQPVGNSNSLIGCKKIELNRSKKISVNDQIFFKFVIESPLRLWRLQRSALIGMCSVKNVSQSKKPHPNRWTQIYAGAPHVLKKLIRKKIIKVVVFFWRREIAAVTKTDLKKIFPSCTISKDNHS